MQSAMSKMSHRTNGIVSPMCAWKVKKKEREKGYCLTTLPDSCRFKEFDSILNCQDRVPQFG